MILWFHLDAASPLLPWRGEIRLDGIALRVGERVNGRSEPVTKRTSDAIKSRILAIRGVQVLLDRDLAMLYGVETKVLNQAVKRNIVRFPDGFMFQLSREEMENWKSKIMTSNLTYEDEIGNAFSLHLSSACRSPNRVVFLLHGRNYSTTPTRGVERDAPRRLHPPTHITICL